MGELKQLQAAAGRIAKTLARLARDNTNLLIVTHNDADGLTSASLLAHALLRVGGRFTLRPVPELTPQLLATLGEQKYDYYVLTDLGAGFTEELVKAFGDRWVVIDHHRPPNEEAEHTQVFNCWGYGFDGGIETCAATLTYLVVEQLIGDEGRPLAWLPVVAGVADRQDQGEGSSLLSLNRMVLEEAVKAKVVEVKRDLLFYGRASRPIHEAIAMSTTPFIPGLSGNRDAALAALASTGLRLKEDGRWRTLTELNDEEKRKVIEAIVPHLTPTGEAERALAALLGEVYVLKWGDPQSPLSDAREFGTLLNACGKMGRPDLGVALCLGDLGRSLEEAERMLAQYRKALHTGLQSLMADPARRVELGHLVVLRGDGLVRAELVSGLASILSYNPNFEGKVILVRGLDQNGEVKFSARRTSGLPPKLNLGDVLRVAAKAVGGVGGGHSAAAGAKVPLRVADQFIEKVEAGLKESLEGEG